MATTRSVPSRIRAACKSACLSGPFRDRWQQPDRVLAALEVAEGQRVVDLGAGGGYFTGRLARAVGPTGRVYAVEPDVDLRGRIAARAARAGAHNVVPQAPRDEDDPGLVEPVDLVLVVDAFHHLPADRVAYFARLAPMFRPGGRLVILEPLPRWYLFGHATEPGRIRATLADAGYAVVVEHDLLPRQSFTVFAPPSTAADVD